MLSRGNINLKLFITYLCTFVRRKKTECKSHDEDIHQWSDSDGEKGMNTDTQTP